MIDTERFLTDSSGKYAASYAKAVHGLATAVASGDERALKAREQFRRVVRETMGVAEVVGALSTLQRYAGTRRGRRGAVTFNADDREALAFADQPIVPKLTFNEALDDFIARTPETIRDAAERTAKRIAELYSERHVIAFVKSAEDAVTRAAKAAIIRTFREGEHENNAGLALKLSAKQAALVTEDWSAAYARMAFRTNLGTAVTNGRFRQARDPVVASLLPAFEFDAVRDNDTRPNHLAANGVILRTDHPAWGWLAPPLGYNCRCQAILVSIAELEDRGLVDDAGGIIDARIPPNARPDPDFRMGSTRPGLNGGGRLR